VTRWVRSAGELDGLVAALAGCRAIAVDSESDSLHHFQEKVCLLQIASDRGDAWLVDTLAVRDLGPLVEVFADPRVAKIFHGADYDVATLGRDFGVRFASLFDTMIAARFLGRREFGLQALARSELAVELRKGHQKDDWSARPLSAEQEAYAVADVEHLVRLAEHLGRALVEAGRISWVKEECDAVAAADWARKGRNPDAWLKLKNLERLSPRELAVARELVAWRDARGEVLDLPVFKIIEGDLLVAIAGRGKPTLAQAEQLLARWPRVRGEAASLIAAIERAEALAESELPSLPRPKGRPRPDASVERRMNRLKTWRGEEAERSGLDVSIVLPQRLIDKIAVRGPRDVGELAQIDGIRRWRVSAYAHALLG
jgi:ribonuclease D